MSYTIYALRCRENGRVYVGRTGNPTERFKKHVYNLNHNIHKSELMQSDFNKYGKSSFEMFEIFKTEDLENAKRLEQIVMTTLRTNKNDCGYNHQDPFFKFQERREMDNLFWDQTDDVPFAKAEEETKRRVRAVFDMRNLAEMSRRTGYHTETLRRWKIKPLSIKMVDLLRLEQKTGVK